MCFPSLLAYIISYLIAYVNAFLQSFYIFFVLSIWRGLLFCAKKRITAGHNHCYIIILDTWAGRTPHDRRGGALWCNSEVRIWRDPKK